MAAIIRFLVLLQINCYLCIASSPCLDKNYATSGAYQKCTSDVDCIDNKFLNYGIGNTISTNHVYYCLLSAVSKGNIKSYTCQTIASQPPGSVCEFNQHCESGFCDVTNLVQGYGTCSTDPPEKVPEGHLCTQRTDPFQQCDPKLNVCFTDEPCATGLMCLSNDPTWGSKAYDCSSVAANCTCKGSPKEIGASCNDIGSDSYCAVPVRMSGAVFSGGCKVPLVNKTFGCLLANDIGGACSLVPLNVNANDSYLKPYNAGCLPGSVCLEGRCALTALNPPKIPNFKLAENYDCSYTKLCARGYACINEKGGQMWNCTDVGQPGYVCDVKDPNSCGADGSRVCANSVCVEPHTAGKVEVNRATACQQGLQYHNGACRSVDNVACTTQESCIAYKTLTYCDCHVTQGHGKCVVVPPTTDCKVVESTKDMDSFCCLKKMVAAKLPLIAGWFNEAKAGWSCDESSFTQPFLYAMGVGLGALVVLLIVVGVMFQIRKRSPEGAGYKRIGGH